MSKRYSVQVDAHPVAQRYTDERTIEFSSADGGGLICFKKVDGGMVVEIYRTDDTVFVNAGCKPWPEGRAYNAGVPSEGPVNAGPCPHTDAAGQPITCSEAEAAP
jgi:hypothetical protein